MPFLNSIITNDFYLTSGLVWLLVYIIFSISATIFILFENKEPTSTLAWLLLFWTLPIAGIVLYLLTGRNWRVRSHKKIKKQKKIKRRLAKVLVKLIQNDKTIRKKIAKKNSISIVNQKRILELLKKNSGTIITENNSIEVLQSGEEKFSKLFEDLKNAKGFIHMEYFIWQSDSLTHKVIEILKEKVQQGVEVRIIIDPMGWLLFSQNLLSKISMIKKMRKNGIKVIFFFNKLSPLNFTTLNYPLHRKVVIIDGKIGYTGGMNMGEEYKKGTKYFKKWKDTHLRIDGDCVLILQSFFAQNWNQVKNSSKLFSAKYFPKPKICQKKQLSSVITSGPDSDWEAIRQLFFSLITQAKKNVFIQTPYFIPDAGVLEALKISALSGIKVRLMIAGIPDKKIPYWTAFTYFEELLLSGVKIYHYKAGFLHSKTIAIDSEICTIGSTNLDIRSFQTAYEINTLIFDKKITQKLENDFKNNIKNCEKITLKRYQKISRLKKLRNAIARLTAPLL